jgi:hypothetical protein
MSHKIPNTADRKKEAGNELVISYMLLRKLIGICGMLLPLALAIAPRRTSEYYGLEPSLSDYYYTDRGDFLVVLLSILGIFLFTYKGYNPTEKILMRIAAVCAFGVAFVPTKLKCEDCPFSVHTPSGGVFGHIFGQGIHILFAAVFLICLGYISLKYFPQTDAPTLKKANKDLTQKGKRNIVFKICGWLILSCVFLLALYFALHYFGLINLKKFPIIFVLETIAVEAFALSWITKGELLLPDKK